MLKASIHSQQKRLCAAIAISAVICLAVVGCSPQASSSSSASGSASSSANASVKWSIDMECAGCHSDQKASTTNTTTQASVHAANGAECISCHNDIAALTTVHQNGDMTGPMPTKLKQTTVSAESCQTSGCHDMSSDDFKALTASNNDLVDTNGTHVNPHDVIGLTPGHDDITCASCHSEHVASASAAQTCVACHHTGVYECNTCH